MDTTQFGGRKGAGTDHMLSEMITDQLECLDDNRACTTFISVDFAKAFNRMDHGHCLRSLAAHGASNQTLRMAAAFLEGRSMRIKLSGGRFSSLRPMPGGAPQGTKCSNILFCIAVSSIQDKHNVSWTDSSHSDTDHEPESGSLGLTDLAARLREEALSFPLGGYRLDTRLTRKRTVLEKDPMENWPSTPPDHQDPPRWKAEELIVKKFIDEVRSNGGSKHVFNTKGAALHSRKGV